MGKPRKHEYGKGGLCLICESFSPCPHNTLHDAMSTWIEGELKELIKDLERVDHHQVSEEIWRIEALTQRLGGKP